MSDNPGISVIMPVYNAGEFVRDAIQSILDQTFTDFEFIIIDDGSTDSSLQIIESFRDLRIITLNNPSNIGNYPSRNKGLKIARGKYICVMDADDVSLKQRLERQFRFMEDHPETGLAGSGFRYYGGNSDIFRENDNEKIKVILLRNDCFIHPTLILRHEFLKKYNLKYNEKYYYAADYDLIVRASRFFHVTNIPDILLNYRIHKDQITVKSRQKQMEYADDIALDQLKFLGMNPDESEIRLHLDLLKGNLIEYRKKQALVNWIGKVVLANQKSNNYFNKDEIESFLNSLLSRQTYLKECVKIFSAAYNVKEDSRQDLMDVTFLIQLKIDSRQRLENLTSVTDYLTRNFSTNIIILEVDNEQHYSAEKNHDSIQYLYINGESEILTKADLINKIISKVDTPFIAIWDSDVIVPPNQIIEAVNKLRTGEFALSYPYDGRFYCCDDLTSNSFKTTGDIEVLYESVSGMILKYGYHSVSGVLIIDKQKHLALGGEKEDISDFELSNTARHKMIELSGLPVFFSKGCLFQLWYPVGNNSISVNPNSNTKDLKEFLKVCSISS